MSANLAVLVEQMQVALDAIAEAVVFCNADNQVQWCNAAFEQLVNLPNSSIIGHNLTKVLPLRKAGKKVAQALYPSIKVLRGEYKITEYEWQHKQRDELRLQISGSCVVVGGDRTCVLTIRNVTEATENQRTAAALKASETKFRAIVENANDIFVLIDPATGKLCYISPKVSDLLGYTPAEMEGQSFEPFVHPDDLSKCRKAFQRVITTGEKQLGVEHRVRHKNGSWKGHLLNASTLLDDEGNLLILGTGWDITDRKLAEATLKASEAKLNMILSSALGAVSHYRNYSNRTWEIEYHSPGCVWVWGYTAEELMADQYLFPSRMHPDDLQEIYRNAYDYIFDERSYEFEYRYFHPDGSLRWIAMTLTSTRDDAADCWRTTVISIDITDRKRAELALVASENRLTTILNRALAVIYGVRIYDDGEWKFDYCSPASIQLWGYQPSAIIADKNIFVSRLVPEDLAVLNQRGLESVCAGEACEGEYRYNHPDGSLRWFAFSFSPERDEAADCWMATIIATDITDKKRTEAALKVSEARLNAIFDSALAGIERSRVYANRDWVYEYYSPGGEKIFGYSALELMADKNLIVARIHPQDWEVVFPQCFDAVFAELSYNYEYRYFHPDGNWRWISATVTSVRDEAADCWIATNIATDITDRKRAEEALKASETRLTTILNRALATIYRVRIYDDGEWEFEYCSPASIQLWGCAPEALMADKNIFVSRMVSEDFAETYTQCLAAVFAGESYEGEYRYNHPDGSLRWITFSLSPERDEAADCWIATNIATDITDKKRAEAALVASEARLNTILNSTQAVIQRLRVQANRQWEMEYCSQGSLQIWGYSPEALIADQNLFLSRIVPEDLETTYAEGFEAIFTEEKCQVEYRYNHPDGSLRWISCSLKSERDEATNSWICTCISTDITARKQAEEALRLSEARIRALYESISFAIILGSPNGIVDCNSAAEKLFMCSREEMVGKHVSVFSSPLQPNGENSYTLANQMIAIATKKGNHRFEWIHRRADGVDFPAEVCLTAVEVGANKFVQAIVQDLSDRKQAEAALAQRASLAAFRADVGSALGMSDSLLMMLNRCVKAAVKHLNISCARIWMLNPAENIFELQANAGCDNRGNGTSDRINFNRFPAQVGKNNAILKNKSIVNPNWVRRENIIAAASYPLTLEAETLGMLAIFSNSEFNESTLEALEFAVKEIALGIKRKQTEAALKVAKETAENASKAKSIFLANMSHELRTPLNAILGFSQLMERDPAITSRQRESLGIINRSGEHLLALIDDVLEMSKIEAGRIVLNPVAFNLHLLLTTLQEMFQVRTQSKQLFLEFDIAADLPQFVVTDEGKLRQVLINLLGNAVKFTKNGGITLRASVNSAEFNLNPQLFFAIEDTGKGIASEEMERLFQPFVQTESGIQSKEGTGLGLTISRQYVQLMGGNIDCHSVLGEGSVFSFNLPVKLAQSGEMIAQPTTKGRVIQIAPNQPSYRILIVDDRQENCELLLQLLQPVGFEIKTAANGEQAIAIWQQWHPHLIFMDMRMPLMDGYEATRQIKAMQVSRGGAPVPAPESRGGAPVPAPESRGGAPVPAPGTSEADSFPQTAIVALTASAFEEQQANVLAAGCDDFVRKPFREQVIFEKLAQYLKVEYIYEEPPAQNSTSPINNQITQLSYIEQMPSAWIEQLYQAAIAVDGSAILQLIAEIPPERDNLAQELNSLLHNFCFDEIIEMIETVDS